MTRRRLIATATAVPVVIVLGAVAAFAGGFDKTTTERVTGGTKSVRVALVDATVGFDVTPDVVAVDPGTHLILDVMNDGDGVHDLAVDGGTSRTRMLEPGESQRLDLGVVTADIRTLCTLPGHEPAGMSQDIQLRSGGGS